MKLGTILSLTLKNLEHGWYKITGQRECIIPYKIMVELTTQCNSRCVTCDIWKIKKENQEKINLEHFERFLDKMNNHLLWLALTGGEISSYNQFPEMVQLIKKHCTNLQILTFTTNGLLPQRILEFALLMKREIQCDMFITISLDGDPETHDKIRGIKGNYDKCMETYDLLKKNGFDCHFGITVAEYNYDFIMRRFKEYRDKIKAVTIYHTGGIFLTETKTLPEDSNQKIFEAYKEVFKQYRPTNLGELIVKMYLKIGVLFLKNGRRGNIIPCDVGLSSAHVMANGNLVPCMYLPPIKRIAEGFELSDYHNSKAQELLEEIKKDKCPHCWMSCYGPHSMFQSPLKSISATLKSV